MANSALDRDRILSALRISKQGLVSRYGVLTLGLFGSVAREEAHQDSDVDVVLTLRHPRLFTLAHVKEELENVLQHKVDLVHYRKHMNPLLKRRIDAEAIYV